MSRTYKDMRNESNRHRWRRYFEWECNWLSNEPRWWRKLFKHIPRRREAKQVLKNIQHGKTDTEDAIHPTDKKPWRYYY